MLIDRSQADGTTSNYGSKFKQWTDFCSEYNLDPKMKEESGFCWYIAHRFYTTKNKKNSVSGEISGIISTMNSFSLTNKIDRNEFGTLRKVIKGFGTFPDRMSGVTFPIRNYELKLMMVRYKGNSFKSKLWKAMHCFAKGFLLRRSEYTMTKPYPTRTTIYWKSIYIFNNNGAWYIQFTITWSKTNKNFKTEILTKRCTCGTKLGSICPVHSMAEYISYCIADLDVDPNSIVFRYKTGKPVTQEQWSKEFDNSLRYINLTPQYPKWRTNSLRHGEITDQIAAGVHLHDVQKFCRHTFDSKSTWLYTHLSSKEDADNRYEKEKLFFNN